MQISVLFSCQEFATEHTLYYMARPLPKPRGRDVAAEVASPKRPEGSVVTRTQQTGKTHVPALEHSRPERLMFQS